jgi:hypothetical protein
VAPAPAPTATDDCEWPSTCEGSQIVDAVADPELSGEASLAVGCRVALTVDGSEAYGEDVPGYERVPLTVKSSGEVDVDAIVY